MPNDWDFQPEAMGSRGLPADVRDASNGLIHALKQQPAYRKRAALFALVMGDDAMRSLYMTYARQKETLQLRQGAGIEPTAEETNAMAAFGHLMGQHPALQDLVMAEAELEGMVGQALGEVMRQVMWDAPGRNGN